MNSGRRSKTPLRGTGLIGFIIVVCLMLTAIFAPVIAPHDPAAQDLAFRIRPPSFLGGSPAHLLGTDALGRDILSRIIYGSRISLLIGLVSVGIGGVVGVFLGLLAGLGGRRSDAVIGRLIDVQMAIPFLVLALTILAVVGGGLRNVIIVLAVNVWVAYARITRSRVVLVRELDYVKAAEASGASGVWIALRHVLPAVLPSVLVIATLQVGQMMLAAAGLSFLGLGVPPSVITWGEIAADGRGYLTNGWWITTAAGLAIFITVMGINWLGDWLHDRLDPTLRDGP